MTQSLDRVGPSIEKVLSDAVVDDREAGVIKANRRIFTDEEMFELEMKHIFEGNWVYLAHESQIPNPATTSPTYIGRQPVVITRSKDGKLNCLANTCTHRGAMLCRHKKDNRIELHLPVPRLDLQQRRQAAQGQGPRRRRLPRAASTANGSHDLTKLPALRELPRLPVRQRQPRRAAARGAPGRGDQDHRHDRRPVARGPRGAARLVHLHLRRQLEGAGGERRRRLPRLRHCTGTTPPPPAAAAPASRRTRPRPWTPAAGASTAAATSPIPHGHLCLWTWAGQPGGPAAVTNATNSRQQLGDAKGDFMVKGVPQPVPVPECVSDGPVLDADPALPADRAGQDRGHDLLHRPERRERRGPRAPDPPVRGLLQRLRHGHARRPRGVPLLPARPSGPRPRRGTT